MGKLRLFGHNWKVVYVPGRNAGWDWDTRKITIGKNCSGYLNHMFFHELLELVMSEMSTRYYGSPDQDPKFFITHGDLDNIAKTLYNSFADNGFINEKKIKKLIEEK